MKNSEYSNSLNALRLLSVAVAATFLPALALLAMQVSLESSATDVLGTLKFATWICLFVVFPVTFFLASKSLYALRYSIFTWTVVGIILALLLRLVPVGVAWILGRAPYPTMELLGPFGRYSLHKALSDWLILLGVGMMVWSWVFLQRQTYRAGLLRVVAGMTGLKSLLARTLIAVFAFSVCLGLEEAIAIAMTNLVGLGGGKLEP